MPVLPTLTNKLFTKQPKAHQLVLIAGWTRSAHSYQDLVNLTPQNWKTNVLPVFDLTPNGQIKEIKKFLLRYINELSAEKIVLAGHSLGGAIALEFASLYPDKVEALVLMNSEGIPGLETNKEILRNFLWAWAGSWKRTISHNWQSLLTVFRSPKLNLELATQAYLANFQHQAKAVKVPTLILWGERDLLTPLWQGEALHWYISRSKLVVLKTLDHDWVLHRPQLFWKHLTAFLPS